MYARDYRGRSFGHILDLNGGAGLGFDLLRLGLAIAIMLSHASGITGNSGITTDLINGIMNLFRFGTAEAAGTAAAVAETHRHLTERGIGHPFMLSHVPMFFALSGFLVAGSALRTQKLVKFLGLRTLRILPALFVEVFLSAIILGAFFTSLPLETYFTSGGFYRYFLNIIGWVHFYLPGVFDTTPPNAVVNANLWTLPFELECYVLMAFIMFTTLIKRPKLLTAIFLVATIPLLIANSAYGFQVTDAQLDGRVLLYYFIAGVLCFLWRYKIVFHEFAFLAFGAAAYWLMMYDNTVYIYPIMLTYVTVFVGLFPFPQFKLLKTGDYSYGIYLYGFPVTRGLVEMFPDLRNHLALTSVLAIALTCIFAAFSWHAVEKHFLKLKRYLSPRSAKISIDLHPGAFEETHADRSSQPHNVDEAAAATR